MTKLMRTDLFWRAVIMLVRLDMAAGILIAAVLFLWLIWLGPR